MKNKQAYKNLPVWNDSLELVKITYLLSDTFPEDEKNGISKTLKKQIIRIPVGISKAMQADNGDQRKQYLEQADNAITEIETLLIIAQKLEFIESKDLEDYTDKSDQISTQIKGLIQKFSK